MGKATKTKGPSDPAAAARVRQEQRRKDFIAVGLSRSSADLTANDAVGVERASRGTTDKKAHTDRARRYDVFQLLYSRKSITPAQLEAVRHLEEDIATSLHADGFRPAARVDTSGSSEAKEIRAIEAGNRVAEAYAALTPRQAQLLKALCEPTTDSQRVNWRQVVIRTLGDHRKAQQADYVILACEALANHYAAPRRSKQAA